MYLNAFKNNRSTFMRESGGQLRGDESGREARRLGLDRRVVDEDRRGRGAPAGRPLHPARRQRPGRPDGARGAPLLPRPAARRDRPRHRLRRQAPAASSPARASCATTSSSASGSRRSASTSRRECASARPGAGIATRSTRNSEFYADYGNFDVSMTVPSKFVVGATGKRVSETKAGDQTHLPLRAERRPRLRLDGRPALARHRVHLRPGPRRACGMERAGRRRARHDGGRDRVEARAGPPPAPARPRVGVATATSARTREALSFYGLWFGAYPYETLTVVDPPDDGMGSGGMEYPTFITGGVINSVPHPLAVRPRPRSSRS